SPLRDPPEEGDTTGGDRPDLRERSERPERSSGLGASGTNTLPKGGARSVSSGKAGVDASQSGLWLPPHDQTGRRGSLLNDCAPPTPMAFTPPPNSSHRPGQ